MMPEEVKARTRRLPEELLTQGDLAVAGEVIAPTAASVTRWVRALRQAFPDLCALVEDEIAEGDRVVQRLTLSGTHRGDYCGLPPTGRRATWQLVAIQRLGPDGKIVEHWVCPDHLGLLRQLGALPVTAWSTDPTAEERA